MNHRAILCGMQSGVIALMLTLAVPGAAMAGKGGGVHGGGGGYSGHFSGRTGPYGGGFRDGFRGGFGHYRGWGWDGLGYGLFFDSLPLYYSTLWWNDLPYYYADPNYYQWNSALGAYETVRPPLEVKSQIAVSEPTVTDLFMYPKNGQNTEQQAQDRSECRGWAAQQTGFDPTQAADTAMIATVAATTRRQDYLRAQAACLEARGYSVK
jgi:hypothetical protein